jgi:hypothetical protein
MSRRVDRARATNDESAILDLDVLDLECITGGKVPNPYDSEIVAWEEMRANAKTPAEAAAALREIDRVNMTIGSARGHG